jgi:type III secretion protein D
VAFGLLAFVSVATPARVGVETEAQRLDRLLLAPEFRGLSATRGTDDRLNLRGNLLTLADRARLDRSLAEFRIDATMQVMVGEQISNAVRDVYRMNGVMADAPVPASLGDVGTVQVHTASADTARLERIEAAVRQDVSGLKQLKVVNEPPPVVAEPTPVMDDPGKRVASIVPGENGYVVTVDGTRYFVGALLPSGHRLASVSDAEVMLEKDGKLSPLKF